MKLKLITIGAFLILLSTISYLGKKAIEQSHEIDRITSNYENALHIDSLEVVIFKVKKANEIEDLLNQNKGLKDLVEKSNVKTKRIENLYYQELKVKNTEVKETDVSSIVKNIRKDIPIKKLWVDKTDCLSLEGFVSYANDSLSVGVTSREFNNNIALIWHKGRKKPLKWLFGLRLGKRPILFKQESKCGEVKVQIIEKE